MAKTIGKRNFRRKRATQTVVDFGRTEKGDFSKPMLFSQTEMDKENDRLENSVTKGMEKFLGPVPKGRKSLGQ